MATTLKRDVEGVRTERPPFPPLPPRDGREGVEGITGRWNSVVDFVSEGSSFVDRPVEIMSATFSRVRNLEKRLGVKMQVIVGVSRPRRRLKKTPIQSEMPFWSVRMSLAIVVVRCGCIRRSGEVGIWDIRSDRVLFLSGIRRRFSATMELKKLLRCVWSFGISRRWMEILVPPIRRGVFLVTHKSFIALLSVAAVGVLFDITIPKMGNWHSSGCRRRMEMRLEMVFLSVLEMVVISGGRGEEGKEA